MKWIQQNEPTYYDIYKCSECGTTIMLGDGEYLPCYCKFCEEDCEDEE